ncbi:MAG: aminotransferase class IV [Solirubrobacteraceae bacterium]
MFQFIESISFLNGSFLNLKLHNKRMNDTIFTHFENCSFINLETELKIPENLDINILYKCRIIYGKQIEEFSFIPYSQKKINSINLVEDNKIEYSYKYLNRLSLEKYVKENNSDEILIIKNNFITDTSYSNIIFFNGNEWVTPSTFLLNGIGRQILLSKKLIVEKKINIDNLKKFTKFKLINAMLSVEKSFTYDVDIIKI